MFRPRMMIRSLIRPVTNKLAIAEEAQVAGAEERARRPSGRAGAEDVLASPRAAPSSPARRSVPRPRSRRRDPPGSGIRSRDRRSRHDAGDDVPARGRTEPLRTAPIGSATSPRAEGLGVRQGGHRPAARTAARDEQRRLGQAVAGEERLAGGSPPAANASANRSSVSARTGSAPLNATRQRLRSSPSRCSGVVFSTQRS